VTTFNIPESWLELNIGDIADVIAGGTPKAAELDNFAKSGTAHAWLTPADLSKYNKKYISYGKRDLSQKGLDTSSAKLMPKGAILFSSRAPIGYVVVANNEISTNQGFKSFVFTKHVDSSFAYYYLRSIRDVAESRGSGTTFKELSGANAKKLPFILAPLAEQIQIANKTDELLAQVDAIKTRLDAIPNILKRFRQSVLAAAVSGKLTFAWNQNNSKVKWDRDIIKNISSKIGSGSTPKGGKSAYRESGVMLVRSMNIHFDKIKYKGMAFIDEAQAKKLDNAKVHEDDVLLNITGASIGRVNIAPTELNGARVNQHVAIIRCNKNYILPKYFRYQLSSPATQKWILDENYGATRQALTKGMIEEYKINLPSIDEQIEIVRKIDQYFTFADQIEQRVKDAQTRVNNLTQSILAKAFRGELTAEWREQNKDLIGGENSAEALLDKIKAERESIQITKPKKKKKKNSTKKKCE